MSRLVGHMAHTVEPDPEQSCFIMLEWVNAPTLRREVDYAGRHRPSLERLDKDVASILAMCERGMEGVITELLQCHRDRMARL